MDKPISIIINETKEKIVQVCNASKLPPCILEILMKGIYDDVYQLSQKQIQEDLLIYTNQLTKESQDEEVKKEE